MKYKYLVAVEAQDTNGRSTKRPLVEVTLSRGTHRRRFLALIDSGADQIMMPAAIAEIFGIERSARPERSVIGVSMQPLTGFVGELMLEIAGQEDPFPAPVVFIDAEVPVCSAARASSTATASNSSRTTTRLRYGQRRRADEAPLCPCPTLPLGARKAGERLAAQELFRFI